MDSQKFFRYAMGVIIIAIIVVSYVGLSNTQNKEPQPTNTPKHTRVSDMLVDNFQARFSDEILKHNNYGTSLRIASTEIYDDSFTCKLNDDKVSINGSFDPSSRYVTKLKVFASPEDSYNILVTYGTFIQILNPNANEDYTIAIIKALLINDDGTFNVGKTQKGIEDKDYIYTLKSDSLFLTLSIELK